jgi:hypothetical protein
MTTEGCWLRSLPLGNRLVDDAHDVGLLHDQEFITVDLDLGARPFAEQHAVAFSDINRDELAGLVAATRADGDDLALRAFLLSCVRDDDAAGKTFPRPRCGLLLVATNEGYSTSYLNQPIEVADLRTELAKELLIDGYPQLLRNRLHFTIPC